MKHARRLTRAEKVLIKGMGLDPKYFLRVGKNAESYTFIEIISGKIFTVRR